MMVWVGLALMFSLIKVLRIAALDVWLLAERIRCGVYILSLKVPCMSFQLLMENKLKSLQLLFIPTHHPFLYFK